MALTFWLFRWWWDLNPHTGEISPIRDMNPKTSEKSPDRGSHAVMVTGAGRHISSGYIGAVGVRRFGRTRSTVQRALRHSVDPHRNDRRWLLTL